ncbi:hypothetical protein FXO37_24261 [Capsicum annuum]|nr:hypothetical protein FXO37_24261 [Capsicum annuum]
MACTQQTHVPLPPDPGNKIEGEEAHFSSLPIHVITNPSELPVEFLEPSPQTQLVIGFDCEGVDLCRHGTLCIMQLAFADAIYLVDAIQGGETVIQACKPALESKYITKVIHDCKRDSEIAYSLINEQEGHARVPDEYISFVGLLADPRYCGLSYDEKEEVRVLLRQSDGPSDRPSHVGQDEVTLPQRDGPSQLRWSVVLAVALGPGKGVTALVATDPKYWTYRPLSEQMVRAAADDVRFLLYIYHKMVQKLNDKSLWNLAVRGALYCRCFCINDNHFADWPPLPPIPGLFLPRLSLLTLKENIAADESIPEEETLSVVDVPQGKMGRVIGRKGASILSIKESCKAEIFIGGAKGPPDKTMQPKFTVYLFRSSGGWLPVSLPLSIFMI